MKLIQAAHALTPGDAASNQVFAMDRAFRELGYESAIYANKIDSDLATQVQHFSRLVPDKGDILIYHLTTGTSFTNSILHYPHPVALYYHNITPARYFWGNAWGSFIKCWRGRRQLKKLQANTFFSWAASQYSANELNALGFQPTSVLPILLDATEYRETRVKQELISTYQDGKVNILMVGRVTPHKKQDEAICLLAEYKKLFSDQVRLIIVGNHKPAYGAKLRKLAAQLQVQDQVVFTGKVSFEELCTYYRLCDLLLCLSEHEGFCVPLVESMIFDKPIVAYRAAAVPDTVGDAGVLIAEKQPGLMAQAVYDLLHLSEAAQKKMAMARHSQLALFSRTAILKKLDDDIRKMIELRSGQ